MGLVMDEYCTEIFIESVTSCIFNLLVQSDHMYVVI